MVLLSSKASSVQAAGTVVTEPSVPWRWESVTTMTSFWRTPAGRATVTVAELVAVEAPSLVVS